MTTFKNIEESKQYIDKLDSDVKLLKSIKIVLNHKGLNNYTLDHYIDKFESNTENYNNGLKQSQIQIFVENMIIQFHLLLGFCCVCMKH